MLLLPAPGTPGRSVDKVPLQQAFHFARSLLNPKPYSPKPEALNREPRQSLEILGLMGAF